MPNQPNARNGPTAVLLIAHGSRRQTANDDLRRLADALRQRRSDDIVEVSYLELAEPTIPQAAQSCVEQGAKQVFMLPYFLSAGEHVGGDLDRHRRELAAQFPQVSFTLCGPLGNHPLLIDVVIDRLKQGERSARGEH